jgi:1-acyl-sn-glycerol-3-phosphate acyltransferase
MRTLLCFGIYVLVVLLAIPLFLFCFVTRLREPLLLLGKFAMAIGRVILSIHLDISGRECVDRKQPSVFMANHMSFLDGPLLFLVIPQFVRVIIKKEVLRIPIIGWAMKFVGFVPVDRKGIKSGRVSIEHATRLIKEKRYSYLIFPEGTRSLDGQMRAFRRGAFFLAVNSQAPIIPITLEGSNELMPKGSSSAKKGMVKVVFHAAVPVQGCGEQDIPQLMETVRSRIRSGLRTQIPKNPQKE